MNNKKHEQFLHLSDISPNAITCSTKRFTTVRHGGFHSFSINVKQITCNISGSPGPIYYALVCKMFFIKSFPLAGIYSLSIGLWRFFSSYEEFING